MEHEKKPSLIIGDPSNISGCSLEGRVFGHSSPAGRRHMDTLGVTMDPWRHGCSPSSIHLCGPASPLLSILFYDSREWMSWAFDGGTTQSLCMSTQYQVGLVRQGRKKKPFYTAFMYQWLCDCGFLLQYTTWLPPNHCRDRRGSEQDSEQVQTRIMSIVALRMEYSVQWTPFTAPMSPYLHVHVVWCTVGASTFIEEIAGLTIFGHR